MFVPSLYLARFFEISEIAILQLRNPWIGIPQIVHMLNIFYIVFVRTEYKYAKAECRLFGSTKRRLELTIRCSTLSFSQSGCRSPNHTTNSIQYKITHVFALSFVHCKTTPNSSHLLDDFLPYRFPFLYFFLLLWRIVKPLIRHAKRFTKVYSS